MPPKTAKKTEVDTKTDVKPDVKETTKTVKRGKKVSSKDDEHAHASKDEKWADKLSEHEESEDANSNSGSGSDDRSDSSESESDYDDAELEKDDKRKYSVQQRKPRRRPASEAMNFAFGDYDSVKEVVDFTSTVDLMRTILVRAHRAGQRELKKYMEVGLKALNHECSFPERVPSVASVRGRGRGGSTSYGSHGGSASYSGGGRGGDHGVGRSGGFESHSGGRSGLGRGRGGSSGVGRTIRDDFDDGDSRGDRGGRDTGRGSRDRGGHPVF